MADKEKKEKKEVKEVKEEKKKEPVMKNAGSSPYAWLRRCNGDTYNEK